MGKISNLLLSVILLASVIGQIEIRPDDIDGPTGITGGGGGGTGLTVEIEPVTSQLNIYAEVDCFDFNRNSYDGMDPRNVIFKQIVYHDGPDSIYPYQVFYDKKFDQPATWPATGGPGLDLDINLSNIYFVRFEGRNFNDGGGCYAYGRIIHDRYVNSVYQESFDSGWTRLPQSDFYYNVDWDNNQQQCELLGGDWLFGGDYDGYRCCGDDWIWINNKPVNYGLLSTVQRYDREDANALCLYTDTPDYGLAIDGEQYGMGDRSYFCDNNMENLPYDDMLRYDDPELTRANSSLPFYFNGYGAFETDVGKWSDRNDSNPMFCDASFDNSAGNGIAFEWKTLAEAAQQDQATCEILLGYGWTGDGCCGAPGQALSYNDPAEECDGDQVYNWIRTMYDPSFITSIAYKYEFQRMCNMYMGDPGYTENKACYEGNPVSNNSVLYIDGVGNAFNENGIIYVCQGADNPYGFDVASKCETRGNLAVCTYANDSWYTAHGSPNDYSYDILGYRDNVITDDAELRASVHDSRLPSGVSAGQERECCFINSCWDGERCVDENMKYQDYGGVWEEYDFQADEGKDVYMCSEGQWIGPLEMQYDWFVDTDHPDYCVADYQCACTEDDCGSYIDNGCTNIEDFYTDDYICEDRVWTSRAKLIVTQLMSLASGDYTIFCDDYERAINYPAPIEPMESKINQICVLNSDSGVVLGVSLNSETDNPFGIDVQDVLFNQNTGFVAAALDEDITDCDDAIIGADSSSYGSFRRCNQNNNRIFYNNKTQLLIYVKEGLSSDELNWNYGTYNNEIEGLFGTISSYINSNADEINSHPDILNIEVFRNAHKYSRMYIAHTGSETVFGALETLYDPDRQGNRNYLGVLYRNVDGVDCNSIEEANEHAHCGEQGTDVIVLERRNDLAFPLWTDLTAELRFR